MVDAPPIFITKIHLVKITAYIFLLAVLYYGCNASSGNNLPAEDSLQYYPVTPDSLDQKEFRYYYRVLTQFFSSNLTDKNFNGSILVAKRGAVIYEKYVGYTDLRTRTPLTDSTPLHIASTGKTFTGMAILRMVQEGKLGLNDSISKFFPELPYPGITVKMLLNHRSGLPNYVYFMSEGDWDKEQYVTNNDVLNYLYTHKPRKSFSPNTHFSYSNTNYVLLAMIIEKVSGQPYPDYMREHIFTPLQMNHTYVFQLADSLTATPSFNYNGSYWENDFLEGTYGDKNIYTTARDLLKWDQILYTNQFINQDLLDSAFTPYSNERKSVHNYGLGWRLQMLPNGKKVVYHFGRWHGFNAAFARLIDEKVTIIILGNKFTRNVYNAAHKSYDIFGDYLQEPDADDEESAATDSTKKSGEAETRKVAGNHTKTRR